ncbi:MAG: stage II sporulation protein M [Verrucomicrobia bacterium]|nr:stage II sporulation protein M [Verrucomicrobiota bacterium]
MIIDLDKFVSAERPHWTELESLLDRVEGDTHFVMPLETLRRFHYLYERTSADLAKLTTFAAEPELRRYLETLVARAYAEIHETRLQQHRFAPLDWFFRTLPQTFRRHLRAFWLTVAITMVGVLFGLFATVFDPESRHAMMPFGHDRLNPADRVAREEKGGGGHLAGQHGSFSSMLMTHNTKVSIFTLALGMTWGVGTILVLFSNGVMLGAICVDYVMAGQTKFLLGWLMPHGVIEIPAILIAAQAGFVLAGALIGRGQRATLATRLRAVSRDVLTLICGVALMLVWAGIIESFLSQYHEPVLPYAVKIAFGGVELGLLVLFLARAGRHGSKFKVQGSKLGQFEAAG